MIVLCLLDRSDRHYCNMPVGLSTRNQFVTGRTFALRTHLFYTSRSEQPRQRENVEEIGREQRELNERGDRESIASELHTQYNPKCYELSFTESVKLHTLIQTQQIRTAY